MVEWLVVLTLGAAAGVGYRALMAWERADARRHELELRRLALEEKRAADVLEPDALPADLQLRIDRETEVWAREQLRALVVELYGRHKSWDSVRTELGRMDTLADGREPGWSQTGVRA